MPGRVTSADVAQVARVSRATVSYVLNEAPDQTIPEDTRRRVRDAAAQLGYTPSAAARTLRRGRSDVVLLALPPWPIGHVAGQVIELLGSAFSRHGLTLLVHQLSEAGADFSAAWGTVSPVAVVALEPIKDADRRAMRAAGIAVAVDMLGGATGQPEPLGRSQVHIGRLQVEHLAATGHRHVGYALPDDPRLRPFSTPRLDGVRLGCGELGLDLPHVEVVASDGLPTGAVDAWLGSREPVTAVAAYNDEVAMAVLAALTDQGLSAPSDLAVIGVDDIPVARYAHPPLTTVSVAPDDMVRYTTQAVVAALAGRPLPESPGSETIDVILRDSA